VGRAFVPSAIDRGSNLRSGQGKDWTIGTCCFPS